MFNTFIFNQKIRILNLHNYINVLDIFSKSKFNRIRGLNYTISTKRTIQASIFEIYNSFTYLSSRNVIMVWLNPFGIHKNKIF